MQINLITDLENTAGLATDVELLRGFFEARGHAVTAHHWRSVSTHADLNVYVEKFANAHLRTADRHIGIFNPEWFEERWLDDVRIGVTQIWAKSYAALGWFHDHGFRQAKVTGFLSRDPFDADVLRLRRALHVAGRSSAKGTTAVLRAYWDAAKAGIELPNLRLVSFAEIDPLPPRVWRSGWMSRGEMDYSLNMHRFHLCPSEVEGWGHYITEATACGGIVITTDASPMNEHVRPDFGQLIRPGCGVRNHLDIARHFVDPDQIIIELAALNRLPDDVLDAMGRRARAWNRRRNVAFETIADGLLAEFVA